MLFSKKSRDVNPLSLNPLRKVEGDSYTVFKKKLTAIRKKVKLPKKLTEAEKEQKWLDLLSHPPPT